MRRYLILTIFFLSISLFTLSQTGNSFWFAAPDVSHNHGNPTHVGDGSPIYFQITAVHATHVKISKPADLSFTAVEFDLNAQETKSVLLYKDPLYVLPETAVFANVSDIEVAAEDPSDLSKFIQAKGFLIESTPGEITAYYDLNSNLNREIFALKDSNALGQEFFVSTQNRFDNGYTDAISGFVVVATEDGTQVTINPNGNSLFGIPATTTFTLNRGETFAVKANSRTAANHLQGVIVTSTRPIAVTIYDDSDSKQRPAGTSMDIIGDQTIPTNLIGKEYIVMRGDLYSTGSEKGDRVFFTATKAFTNIHIERSDGVPVTDIPIAAIGGGAHYPIETTCDWIRVTADKPIYVVHVSGAGGGGEIGGPVLPTIDGCTGSHTVTVKRGSNTTDFLIVNLMARNDNVVGSPTHNMAANSFKITVTTSTTIDSFRLQPIDFYYTPDSSWIIIKPSGRAKFPPKIPPGAVFRVDNPVARFHLGFQNGGTSNGGKYGYFSDYASSNADAGIGGAFLNKWGIYCSLDPIQLVADGSSSYQWYSTNYPSARLSDSTVADPWFYPDKTGIYLFNVIVKAECYGLDTIKDLRIIVTSTTDANFSLAKDIGCSPFTLQVTNLANNTIGINQTWIIEDQLENPIYNVVYPEDSINKPLYFEYLLPDNNTDSIQKYTVRFLVQGAGFTCTSERDKGVKVKPYIKADFTVDDSVSCNPLLSQFTNNKIGNWDSTSYTWDFGDFSHSFEIDPSHTFDNNSYYNTAYYNVKLVAESPFGCKDSLTKQMTVYPKVKANFGIDTYNSCTPLIVNMNPALTRGADTLWWNISYPLVDSIIRTTDTAKIKNITHNVAAILNGPDTLYVRMIAGNQMGCHDTTVFTRLIAFPRVDASFSVSEDSICDSDTIQIDNLSQGFSPFYSWDWGNNIFNYDLSGQSYARSYTNRKVNANDIPKDTTYIILLRAESEYTELTCWDTMSIPITVHPYIDAKFGWDYVNNCSPIQTFIDNQSTDPDHNFWDFGYGEFEYNYMDKWDTVFVNHDPDLDTIYSIHLRTTNDEGCSAETSRTLKIYPEVVANFGIAPDVVCSPDDVTFTNSSRGGNILYVWDFGDGVSSTDTVSTFIKNYMTIEDHDVYYYIHLNVKNQTGCDSSWYDTVKVLANINTFFDIPYKKGCSPFKINPINYSSPGSKEFRWNIYGKYSLSNVFSDTAKNPDIPAIIDTATIDSTLIVELVSFGRPDDAEHHVCADTHRVEITAFPEMHADFTVTPNKGCQPLMVNFSNNSNITAGHFKWYIDNVFYLETTNPASRLTENETDTNETHIVDLFAETLHGCKDTFSLPFTVYSLVNADFTINDDGICSGDSFVVDRSNTRGGITEYNWNFNNEETNTDTTKSFYYSYDNLTGGVALLKFVRLTVNNFEGCTSSQQHNIFVYPKVTADFELDDYDVCFPHRTTFTNNSTNAFNYSWTYGDGAGSSEFEPEYKYMNFDPVNDVTRSIKLLARSTFFCYDSIRKDITIYAKPKADFIFPHEAIDCPPFTVTMKNHSEVSAPAVYFWDFDGTGTSSIEEPTHTFSNNGSDIKPYPITLIVTSDKNCSDTMVKPVNVYPNVIVAFEKSPDFGCSPLNVEFHPITTTNATDVFWKVNGTLFSTISDPTYRFSNDSEDSVVYSIVYKAVSLYECEDSAIQFVTVYPTPRADFKSDAMPAYYDTEAENTTVKFTNLTEHPGTWEYEWDFGAGPGSTSNNSAQEFTHDYGQFIWGDPANNNRIFVSLTAWNNTYESCRDSVTREIIIIPPVPQVDLAEDIGHCVPYDVDFTATTKYIDGTFNWDFGDGFYSTEPEPSHSYANPGVYTVTLRVQGPGGSNHDYKLVDVYEQPSAKFSFNDSIVFDSSQTKGYDWINFYNHSKFANSYAWYFNVDDHFGGIPADSDEEEPSWHYNDVGVYYVALIALSGEGCVDTFFHKTAITVLGEGYVVFPNAFFVTPDGPSDEYDTDREDNKMVFYPLNQGVYEYKLEVYDRWGVLVFESDDVNHGWNGYIKGIVGKQDVYIWRARGRFTNGQPFDKSGDVTLIHGRIEAIPQ